MSNEIKVHTAWYHKAEDENYAVVNIFVDDHERTVVCANSLNTGYYDEWYLHAFYRDFTFVSEESLYQKVSEVYCCLDYKMDLLNENLYQEENTSESK